MELDLKDDLPMRMVRFTGVRATANDVVTTAHPSTVFTILDDITIEAQLIARVTRALGFGGEEVEVPNLTDDDLIWLTADGAAVMIGEGGGDHIDELGVTMHTQKADAIEPGVAHIEELGTTNIEDLGIASHTQKADAIDGHIEEEEEGRWVRMKEETVRAILQFKMSKLRTAISAAKSRAFISS